jgi:succinate dehydrogenase/fumarate reductase cytochrome b subunit
MAAFHSCNGLWTLCITWGVTLSERSRLWMRALCHSLMGLLIFLGLSCIWGVYWVNLRY